MPCRTMYVISTGALLIQHYAVGLEGVIGCDSKEEVHFEASGPNLTYRRSWYLASVLQYT